MFATTPRAPVVTAILLVTCLAATILSQRHPAQADEIGSAGCVAAMSGRIALTTQGRTFYLDGDSWREINSAIPIPVAEVAFFGGEVFVDRNGDGWAYFGNQWRNNGAPGNCSSPISVQPSTWSQIKTTIPEGTGH